MLGTRDVGCEVVDWMVVHTSKDNEVEGLSMEIRGGYITFVVRSLTRGPMRK